MASHSAKRIKAYGINLLLVVFSVAFAVILAEMVVRMAGYKPQFAATQFFRYDPLLGWRLQPALEGPFERPQFHSYVKINSRGLRGTEHPYEKPPGKKRILVLGDSFVWGFGVNDDEIFTALMEKDLPEVEVINGGVTAYGTTQELLWLEREGIKYQPDLVVVVLYRNDLVDNITQLYNGYYRPLMIQDRDGALHLTGVPCPEGSLKDRFRKRLVRYSALAGLALRDDLRMLLALDPLLFGSGEQTVSAPAGKGEDRTDDYAERLTVALMRRIKEVSAKHQARLLVVTLCHGNESCEEVATELRKEGFPVLSMDRSTGYSLEQMVIPGEEHWNASGHRFTAETIEKYVADNGLLP
jgi:hypothetical protein